MSTKKNQQKDRMIHIRLELDLHKRLRLKAAEDDKTIQQLVVELISKYLSKKYSNSKKQ